ncbi:MAG: spore germination protein, partial [Clostridia bacterium]|nr:spore germination protein [Clostridia bacterium]
MLRKIFRKIKYNSKKKHVSGAESDAGSFGCVSSTAGAAGGSGEISPYLYINEKTLKSIFEGTDDIRFRNITLNSGNSKPKNAMLVFIDGMADIKVITEAIVEPFLYGTAIAG